MGFHFLHDGVHAIRVVRVDGALQLGDVVFNRLLHAVGQLVAIFLQLFFKLEDHGFGAVLRIDGVLPFLVFVRMGLRIVDHVLDFVFGEAAVRGDRDLLLLAGAKILSGDVQDAVRVDIERDFDLRDATGRRRDRIQMELADGLVVLRHRAFALQHMDFNARLVVGRRGEDFALLVRNRRVAFDQFREDAAQGFDTEGQRRDIQQDDVVDIALQDAALNSRADGDDFVRVHAFVRGLAEDFLSDLLGARHTGHTTDQDHFVDFGSV